MDKKTRVLNCIDNKPIDKVPFSYWHHYHGEDAVGKTCVAAHKKLYDETNMDFIKMMSDGYFTIGLNTPINTPSDWDKVKLPSINSPFVTEQIDRVKWMREAIKDEACVFYIMFSAYAFLWNEYGIDLCDTHMKDDEARKHMLPVLNQVGDFAAQVGAKIITDGGATGIHQSMSANYRFSAEQYKLWIRPQDEKMMKACNAVSNYNIVHLCGWDGIPNHLYSWNDYEGAVLHWDQHTDKLPIEEAKVIFKNRRALMAGFDNKVDTFFYTACKEDVKEVAKNYARAGGKTGFILSSDCSLNEAFPYERINWVREAMEELAAE